MIQDEPNEYRQQCKELLDTAQPEGIIAAGFELSVPKEESEPEASMGMILDLSAQYLKPPDKFEPEEIMQIIGYWLTQRDQSLSPKRGYPKPRRSIYDLTAEERNEIDRRLWILLDLLVRQILYGRIRPRGKLERGAQALGVKWRDAREMLYKLEAHILDHGDDPERWGECLIDNRGRPKGTYTKLTEDHLRAIRLGISHRDRIRVHADGRKSDVELQPGIDIPEDVYEFAKGMCPDLPSVDTVRDQVRRLCKKDPAYYKLLTEGDNALRRDAAPKKQFDVDEVDDIWSWDACDLPKYIQHDGMVCTAVLLEIIDQKSDNRIHRIVIPKKEKDESGAILGVSFKKVDAMSFVATAMRRVNRRPLYFYNDNDKRLNLEDHLSQLTAPGETPIQMHLSRPGEPWGRGLKEGGFARRLQRVLRRSKGYYNKRNRNSIRKAIKNPNALLTAEQLQADLDPLYEELNHEPRVQDRNRKKSKKFSRADVYYGSISPRPCPPVRRLFHLLPPERRREDWVVLDDIGFDFAEGGETHWVPTIEGREKLPTLYLRWMNAAISGRKCHFYAVKLDTGWVAEICLEDEWFEAIPRSKSSFSVGDHMWARNQAIKTLRQRINTDYYQDVKEALEKFGALPEQLITTVRGEYRLPEKPIDTSNNSTDASTNAPNGNVESDRGQSTAGSDVSTPPGRSHGKGSRKGKQKRDQPIEHEQTTKLDWSDLF